MIGIIDRHKRWLPAARRASLVILLIIGGCQKSSSIPPPAPAAVPSPLGSVAASRNVKLAYSHNLQLEMPATSVKPRYDRAIKSCLEDAKFNCVVLNTSISLGDPSGVPSPSATLSVRLPHDAVAPFEAELLKPLPEEAAGDAILRSQSTTADDLTAAIADLKQRQAHLTDYRDRLTELLKRPDVKVEDLIKIESELSNTQSQIESIAAQKKTLDQRVETESLSISLESRSDNAGSFFAPVIEAWDQAGQILGESTAAALRVCIGVLPWLPIIIIGLLLVRFTFRRWRR